MSHKAFSGSHASGKAQLACLLFFKFRMNRLILAHCPRTDFLVLYYVTGLTHGLVGNSIKVNGVTIQMLRFADDIAIIAPDGINLRRGLESLDGILKSNYKMKINRKKTEVMVCSKDFENVNIKMDDNDLT